MNKVEKFEDVLQYIKDQTLKADACYLIDGLPDYFFEVPASSTGKYHPSYALGEGGLTREVRAINLIEKRLKEVEKLGFKTCIIPESNKKGWKDNYKLDIIGVHNINEAIREIFKK